MWEMRVKGVMPCRVGFVGQGVDSDVFIALGQILIISLQEFSKGLWNGSLRKGANPHWTELLDSAAISNILIQSLSISVTMNPVSLNHSRCLFCRGWTFQELSLM